MADEPATTTSNAGEAGAEQFDPTTLTPAALEYIRRSVQAESDRKTAVSVKDFQSKAVAEAKAHAAQAELNELQELADSGDFESVGKRVANRMSQQTLETNATIEASNLIENQMVEKFSSTLGAEAVETIRQTVVTAGGAHAEFAEALANATAGKNRAEEIQAEVRAALIEAGVIKRTEDAGASTIAGTGRGPKLGGFEEIEAKYGRGEVSIEVYEEALKAR